MKKDIIYCKDCSSMNEIPSCNIDLIISGPPYWDYINYGNYTAGRKFTWIEDTPYESFFNAFRGWYSECYRVLRPGRYCVVCLGTVRRRGKNYPIPFHAVSVMEKLGFEFCYEIVWRKLSGGRPHAGTFIQNPFPGYYIPNCRTEYLLVFRKDSGIPFCDDKRDLRKEENKITVDELFTKEVANNVWHLVPGAYPLTKKHPCPFPMEIPFRLIQLLSLKGETVLDPFMGIGTTARAAKALNRHFIGYELQKEFIAVALAVLEEKFKLREPSICDFRQVNPISRKK